MEATATSDRLRWLLTFAVIAGVAALVVWRLTPDDQDPAALLPVEATSASLEEGPVESIGVDVVGAVRRPGMYYLPQEARVEDAIKAAGGLAPDADREAINLAARVMDEQQIRVPRVGEGSELDRPVAAPAPGGALVDLNTADLAALDALPGIGPVTAQRIIDYRTAHGLFRNVDQLEDVNGIGDATLDALRGLVVVQP